MATIVAMTQANPLLAVAFNGHECAHCRQPIVSGERWVREKIYKPVAGDAPRYQRYHADLFADENLSCWEKHQLQQEGSRAAENPAYE
jgi:hypothetical protein